MAVNQPERFPALYEVVTDLLPLSLAAVQEVGPAAQTLAAIYRLATARQKFQTFARIAIIRDTACLGCTRTVQRHLETLLMTGWVECKGRQLNASCGKPRRTNTLVLSKRAIQHREPFAPLARWAAAQIGKLGLSFSDAAVFSMLAAEDSLRQAAHDDQLGDYGGGAIIDSLLDLNISRLARRSGMTRDTVRASISRLCQCGLLQRHNEATRDAYADVPEVGINWELYLTPGAFPPPAVGAQLEPANKPPAPRPSRVRHGNVTSPQVSPRVTKTVMEGDENCHGSLAKSVRGGGEKCPPHRTEVLTEPLTESSNRTSNRTPMASIGEFGGAVEGGVDQETQEQRRAANLAHLEGLEGDA